MWSVAKTLQVLRGGLIYLEKRDPKILRNFQQNWVDFQTTKKYAWNELYKTPQTVQLSFWIKPRPLKYTNTHFD